MKSKYHLDQETQIKVLSAKGFRIFRSKKCKAVAAVGTYLTREGVERIHYKVWQGNASKPCANYLARSMKQVEESVTFYFDRQAEREQSRIDRRNRQKKVVAGDFFQVGDVISYSWGYDQTNVDFFQVVRVLNRQIEVREVCQNNSDHQGGPSGGYTQPRRFEFVEGSKPFKKTVKTFGDNDPYVSFDHGVGKKWTGKALYTSSYH